MTNKKHEPVCEIEIAGCSPATPLGVCDKCSGDGALEDGRGEVNTCQVCGGTGRTSLPALSKYELGVLAVWAIRLLNEEKKKPGDDMASAALRAAMKRIVRVVAELRALRVEHEQWQPLIKAAEVWRKIPEPDKGVVTIGILNPMRANGGWADAMQAAQKLLVTADKDSNG